MGVSMFDIHSLGHLFSGMLSFSLLRNQNIPTLYNFIISNGVHYFIEINEKDITPDGRVLETYQNHVGDNISFFTGWMIGSYYKLDNYINSENSVYLWTLLLAVMSKEFLREIYPNNPWLTGAYT